MSPSEFPRTELLPEEFAAPLAACAERLGPFRRQIMWYAELPSTSDLAAAFAERGAREGCVILAASQTAGRGRMGRSWCSPPDAGLYASVILRPRVQVLPLLTLAAGVALSEGIETATGLPTSLKWPNDIFAGGRKLAGILAESGGGDPQHVILGFGVNLRPAAYPPEVGARATSIEGELGREIDRGVLLAETLAALAARYEDLQREGHAGIVRAWRERAAAMLGRPVEWDAPEGIQRGIAQDIDEAGALLVRGANGVTRVISGEVRWT